MVSSDPITTISAVHPDILQTHIFPRLDGPTLASAGCASTQLHALTTESDLWRDICLRAWPSTADQRVHQLISTFPAGHRSFFSDSFPSLGHPGPPSQSNPHRESPIPTTELLCAVDVYYRKKLILSKVQEVETVTGWFLCSPFRIDLLEHREMVPMPAVKRECEDDTRRLDLVENLTLSWILIDPTRKRAGNFSSLRPVSVERHWLTGEIQARYATNLLDRVGSCSEPVQCGILVTCGWKEGRGLHVREVSFGVVDMDGRNLSGRQSLVILGRAMESGRRRRRRKNGGEDEEQERYDEYMEMKRERRERKERRERRMDMVCIATGIAIFISFWAVVLFR